jgi:VanZ family protein
VTSMLVTQKPIFKRIHNSEEFCLTPTAGGGMHLGWTARLEGCFLPVVPRQGLFFRYWLPVLVWLGVIFLGSTEFMSGERTSRIIDPVLRWLLPALSDESVGKVVFLVRKTAHLVEYSILAILLWRALRGGAEAGAAPWCWRQASGVWLMGVVCAMADEFHQVWVSGRYGTWGDVLLDALGAAIGLLVLWGVGRWRGRW